MEDAIVAIPLIPNQPPPQTQPPQRESLRIPKLMLVIFFCVFFVNWVIYGVFVVVQFKDHIVGFLSMNETTIRHFMIGFVLIGMFIMIVIVCYLYVTRRII